jgi:hypothetical protein
MAESESESPTSSDSTSATSTTSTGASADQAGMGIQSAQSATSSDNGMMDLEGSGMVSGEVAGNAGQQGEEGEMQVQLDGTGAGNDQSEDMIIEAGPSHISKRVKVCPLPTTTRQDRPLADNLGIRAPGFIMVRSRDWTL